MCLFVLSLLLLVSRFDSSHPVCNPADPLGCLPAFSHVGSSILSAQLTVGHVVMRERETDREKIKECRDRGAIVEISAEA